MIDKKLVYFYLGCLPVRLALAEYHASIPFLRPIALAVGLTWFAGLPNSEVGFFGGPAWWANYRPLHGLIWLLYAGTGDNKWLFADAAAGVTLNIFRS